MNVQELQYNINLEGGTIASILDFGLLASDLETVDLELRAHWEAAVRAVLHAEAVVKTFDAELYEAAMESAVAEFEARQYRA